MVDQLKLYTVADLEAMPEDEHTQRELLNGRLITTRIDSRLHQVVHNRLQSLLEADEVWEIANPCYHLRCHLIDQPGDAETLLIADMAVVRNDSPAEAEISMLTTIPITSAPDLAVLIVPLEGYRGGTLSASEFLDLKIQALWAHGLQTLWLVYSEEQTIMVQHRNGLPQTITNDGTVDSGDVVPGFTLTLSELFANLTDPSVPSVAKLPENVIDHIRQLRFDRILEKHEGPSNWNMHIHTAEIMLIDNYQVLLPIDWSYHKNIEVLRCIVSQNGDTLTVFFKDHTFTTPDIEYFDAGRIAICDRIPETEVFIAVVYHEWFAVENAGMPYQDHQATLNSGKE